MAYLLDTDVFVQAKNVHYGFKVCPGFWQWIDHAASRDLILSIKQVRAELLEIEDELSKWIKPRKSLFVDSDDAKTYDSLKLLSTWVIGRYEPAAQSQFFTAADYSLVGYAHAHNHTIVTHEVPSSGHKVKIPNACMALNVPWMNPFEMLKTEGASFVLDQIPDEDPFV